MSLRYPLFRSHLDLAHRYWKDLVLPGDLVIDATCGNGHDTALLAELALQADVGAMYAIDLQSSAIEACQLKLKRMFSKEVIDRVHFVEGCHSRFPEEISPRSVKLIVYNLGYLPGGDKSLTTVMDTTVASLQNALELIQEGGIVCATCYPGHDAGVPEEKEVLRFASKLNPHEWNCCHHRWVNRERAPSLLLIQRVCVDLDY